MHKRFFRIQVQKIVGEISLPRVNILRVLK